MQSSLEVARVGAFEVGSGLPLMIPAIDLIEIGAGGGSIASIDERGLIAVGSVSARAPIQVRRAMGAAGLRRRLPMPIWCLGFCLNSTFAIAASR